MKKTYIVLLVIFCLFVTACSKPKDAVKPVNATAPEKTAPVYNKHGIPVLMYHSIAVEKGNPIRMPAEQFDAEMKYIKESGFTTLTLNELYDYLENKVPVPEKAIVITLDDGYNDNYSKAFPILKKYGLKATVFVVTSTVDKNPACLTSKELIEMDKAGIDIESHTVSHRDLDTLSFEEQLKELKESKAFLEALLGRKVDYLAYPTGRYNQDTIKAAKDAGYRMAFTTNGRWSDKEDGIYTLDRVYISTFHSMEIFKDRLNNPNYKFN